MLLTKRSRGLRSFSGHVSLPGGKADNIQENFETVARREAEEEIGLPCDSEVLLKEYGLKVDNLCMELPHYLSRTFLSVKPVVCFLYNSNLEGDYKYERPLDALKFFGKLNPGETTSMFSIPLSDLIAHEHQWNNYQVEYVRREDVNTKWGGTTWLLRHYYYPNENSRDAAWLNDILDTSSGDEELEGVKCKDVWGLTAKILYDLSKIAHGPPERCESSARLGHDDLIYGLHDLGGQLRDRNRSTWESAMIVNKRGYKYGDVIPEFYMKRLLRSCPKF